MEELFNNHIKFVLNLDTNTFVHIVSSLESGLKGLDTGISTQVCFCDFLFIFLWQQYGTSDGHRVHIDFLIFFNLNTKF